MSLTGHLTVSWATAQKSAAADQAWPRAGATGTAVTAEQRTAGDDRHCWAGQL